ncbi:IS3 family transposase [Streptomyces sp. NPDC058625]|uniref:IS3 family transposase n=1 Tax=Streptomyces sp. NPDC058625 TaxID=3346564 RepID=UPI0036683DAC
MERVCGVLGRDRSGYCTWHGDKEARQEKADAQEDLARRIRENHTDSRGAYGARRITQKLRRQGRVVNRKRVAWIMREREIVGATRQKPRSSTKRNRTVLSVPDLIPRDFAAPMPGMKPVGDIICLPTAEGSLCPATPVGLRTREVVVQAEGRSYTHPAGHPSGRVPAGPVHASTMPRRRVFPRPESRDRHDSPGAGAQARQDVFRWTAEHDDRERIHSAIGCLTPHRARVRCHQRLGLAA